MSLQRLALLATNNEERETAGWLSAQQSHQRLFIRTVVVCLDTLLTFSQQTGADHTDADRK